MSTPTVSIITPTWNRKILLREAMESVRAQTYPTWEHLIVDDGSDDGSDDGTVAMVKTVAKSDARVRLVRRSGEASGANVCRNIGLRESRGEFVVFLDSDDLLAPSCLERRVALLLRNLDLDFATFQTGFFVETVGDRRQEKPEEIHGDDLLRFLTFELPWIITAPIWRREALEKLNGFDETLPSWHDVDLHIRAICGGLKYLRIPEIDNHVRWQFEETKVSVKQRRSPEHLHAAENTLVKFEEYVRCGPGIDWSRQRALCRLYFFLAERWIDIRALRYAQRAWSICCKRGLLPWYVYLSGKVLLLLKQTNPKSELTRRIINKWIGVVRMRLNPDLIRK